MVSRSDSVLVATGEKSPSLLYSKVCLAGHAGVGKTTLFKRLVTGQFVDSTETTLKIDAHKITHEVDGIEVPLMVHDTSGYERVATLSPNFFKGALAVVLMFSVEEVNTLHKLEELVEEAKKYTDKRCFYILVGNKLDLYMDVEKTDVDEAKDRYDCKSVVYISAKEGDNVTNLMDEIALHMNNIYLCDDSFKNGTLQLHSIDRNNHNVIVRKTEKDKCKC